MTEDEAFIRAIVDNPGDDTPRLVYADWLDDRDDPRGPYLRAETEWAQPWREGKRPLESPELQAIAAGLGSLWVARVSRPPLGVCCDSLVFVNSGPCLSETDIEEAERQMGIGLTGAFRAFLLNYNGGTPTPRNSNLASNSGQAPRNYFSTIFTHPCNEEWRDLVGLTALLRSFLPNVLEVPLWDAGPDDVPWQADVLPLSQDSGYFQLFYAVRGQYEGLIQFHDWTGDWCRFGYVGFAPTLPQLLSRLPEGGCGITDTYPSLPLRSYWL